VSGRLSAALQPGQQCRPRAKRNGRPPTTLEQHQFKFIPSFPFSLSSFNLQDIEDSAQLSTIDEEIHTDPSFGFEVTVNAIATLSVGEERNWAQSADTNRKM
jgi:hypothetical protein